MDNLLVEKLWKRLAKSMWKSGGKFYTFLKYIVDYDVIAWKSRGLGIKSGKICTRFALINNGGER